MKRKRGHKGVIILTASESPVTVPPSAFAPVEGPIEMPIDALPTTTFKESSEVERQAQEIVALKNAFDAAQRNADGWNTAYAKAQARVVEQAQEIERLKELKADGRAYDAMAASNESLGAALTVAKEALTYSLNLLRELGAGICSTDSIGMDHAKKITRDALAKISDLENA